MRQAIERLDQAPFPPLTWFGDFEWWEGEIDLESGESVRLVVCSDLGESQLPTPAQAEALSFFLKNRERVMEAFVRRVMVRYQELRPQYLEFLGEEFGHLMPEVRDPGQLRELIHLQAMHIHPEAREGVAYLGLQFSCTWDQEHGCGGLTHLDRVVVVGEAEYGFAISPEEAEGMG
jgi:hypothetical protein